MQPSSYMNAGSGCVLQTGPAIQISCGNGGNLDYPNKFSNCHIDETTSHYIIPTLICQGTTNPIDTVFVTCTGRTTEAVQLEIQVDSHAYRCNQVISEHQTWENQVTLQLGGSAGHHVSIFTLQENNSSSSSSNNNDNQDAWLQVNSESRTSYCSVDEQCAGSSVSCQGYKFCDALVPPFRLGTATSSTSVISSP
jgi:hypothetical protein